MLCDYQERASRELPRTIRAIRLRLGLTGTQFGKAVGTTQAHISEWESGIKRPSLARLLHILSLAQPSEVAPLIREIADLGIPTEALKNVLAAMVSVSGDPDQIAMSDLKISSDKENT